MGNQKEGSLIVKDKVFHAGAQQLSQMSTIERPDTLEYSKQNSPAANKSLNSSLLNTKPRTLSTNNKDSSLNSTSDSFLSGKRVNLISKKTNRRGHGKMKKREKYGMEVILDLYDCDPKIIRSSRAIKGFASKMCKLLEMKKFGQTLVLHFGHDKPKTSGYSMLQFIETSSITGHFSENWNSAYLNIFSCQMFSSKKAISFTKKYFKAKKVVARRLTRA